MHDLRAIYGDYVACLNAREWARLSDFVDGDVMHSGGARGLSGYTAMLEGDVAAIPDLCFVIELLVVDGDLLASRLAFDYHPGGEFLGLPVHGRRVRFAENVFYRFRAGRIAEVRSVIDKAAVEASLRDD